MKPFLIFLIDLVLQLVFQSVSIAETFLGPFGIVSAVATASYDLNDLVGVMFVFLWLEAFQAYNGV